MSGSFTTEYADFGPNPTLYIEVGLNTGLVRNSYGSFTVNVREYLGDVTLEYKTFIHCDAIDTGINPFLYDYYKGDNRWFDLLGGSSRSFQIIRVTPDPSRPTGLVGPTIQGFGQTQGFNGAAACTACPPPWVGVLPYCNWCINQPPACALTAVPGGQNVLQLTPSRVSPSEIRCVVRLAGSLECAPQSVTPAIDSAFVIRFRRLCTGGVLGPLEFKIDPGGSHDGFPWHEVILNGTLVYAYNPCATLSNPNNLFPPSDVSIATGVGGTNLNTWNPVP